MDLSSIPSGSQAPLPSSHSARLPKATPHPSRRLTRAEVYAAVDVMMDAHRSGDWTTRDTWTTAIGHAQGGWPEPIRRCGRVRVRSLLAMRAAP